jgi:hypothetical protein
MDARQKMVSSRMFSNIELDDIGEVEIQLEINHLLDNDHLPRLCIGGVMRLNDKSMRCISGKTNAMDNGSHINYF